jgi:crotonobetainyl-CoA:carnitine CoA-transferase CaiB-like acyl-CoA transferase
MTNHPMLKHLTVIELASVLAGPAVGMFLAELGAKVIKIENPDGGDVTRQWKLPSEDGQSEVSAYFSSVNYGKQYQSINLKTTEGKQAVLNLMATADIVLTNFKSGDDIKLGLDYETLNALNPKLIYACITGFGPNDSRTAFDVVLQAEAGLMYMNGAPESGPIKWPVAVIDLMAAHQLKEGILLALLQRERHGLGAKVSVSLYDAAIASLANQATNWLMAGHIPQRLGSLPQHCPLWRNPNLH